MKIGVLALQGDYEAHIKAIEAAAERAVPGRTASDGIVLFEVRSLQDLNKADAMIIPGGESTVMGSLLIRFGFLDAFRDRILSGMPVFGTCAGLILLSRQIEKFSQPGLGVLDVTIRRNAYGTQVDSFRAPLEVRFAEDGAERVETMEGVFIRAPKIVQTGPNVSVLASLAGDPVLVRQGNILGATFHPELVAGARIHDYFLGIVKKSV